MIQKLDIAMNATSYYCYVITNDTKNKFYGYYKSNCIFQRKTSRKFQIVFYVHLIFIY